MAGAEKGSFRENTEISEAQRNQSAIRRVKASNALVSELKDLDTSKAQIKLKEYNNNKEPISVDATDYEPHIIPKKYRDPNSKEFITEKLVFFSRLDNKGKPEILEYKNGETVIFNGTLFDNRIYSDSHLEGLSEKGKTITLIPIVNYKGDIENVVALKQKIFLTSK